MLITSSVTLTDEALVGRILSTAAAERKATATLIADLAELESRRLHLAQGFKSLFGYCRHVLHCSEHESYNRMHAVHAARRFPVILPMLTEGLLHLTAVRLLAPHLRDEDHLALLGGAIHKSKREVVKRVAGWFPSADVSSTIRKLPGVIAPLSADRYRLQVTLSEAAHENLRFLQDAMRREIPNGDPAAIVERALAALRQVVEKKLFSASDRPRVAVPTGAASRHIPADVERAVWRRDQGQCSFEGPHHRCVERSYLEYHHLTPWIVGGQPSVENIALRCHAHNEYESHAYFAPIQAARAVYYDSFRNESASPPAASTG